MPAPRWDRDRAEVLAAQAAADDGELLTLPAMITGGWRYPSTVDLVCCPGTLDSDPHTGAPTGGRRRCGFKILIDWPSRVSAVEVRCPDGHWCTFVGVWTRPPVSLRMHVRRLWSTLRGRQDVGA